MYCEFVDGVEKRALRAVAVTPEPAKLDLIERDGPVFVAHAQFSGFVRRRCASDTPRFPPDEMRSRSSSRRSAFVRCTPHGCGFALEPRRPFR